MYNNLVINIENSITFLVVFSIIYMKTHCNENSLKFEPNKQLNSLQFPT